MKALILHSITEAQLNSFVQNPGSGLLLSGPAGSGKFSVATRLSNQLLGLDPAAAVTGSARQKLISPAGGGTISIEQIREVERFLSLKLPAHGACNRVVVLENAHLLGVEAQNALLKTLEEPPAGTVLLLTAIHAEGLLPTIRSRLQQIVVKRPPKAILEAYFKEQGFDAQSLGRALAMSGGLPGLTAALLSNTDHPLLPAALKARQLLSQSAFERLAQVDELAKDRTLCSDICFILQQMAHMALQRAPAQTARHWQAILDASYAAGGFLHGSAQPKLVLTNLMLSL